MTTWPDIAPPLDLAVDYSRRTERAERTARWEVMQAEWRAEHPGVEPLERKIDQRAQANQEAADALVPFWTAPAGYCRVCGQPCPTRRHRWHPACVEAYNAVASSGAFRGAVWDRDRGVCAACPPGTPPQPRHNGTRCTGCDDTRPGPKSRCYVCDPYRRGTPDPYSPSPDAPPLEPVGWDADHIVPLIDGGPNTLDNAQTLCLPHHRAKTAAEATARAARRRSTPADPGPTLDPVSTAPNHPDRRCGLEPHDDPALLGNLDGAPWCPICGWPHTHTEPPAEPRGILDLLTDP